VDKEKLRYIKRPFRRFLTLMSRQKPIRKTIRFVALDSVHGGSHLFNRSLWMGAPVKAACLIKIAFSMDSRVHADTVQLNMKARFPTFLRRRVRRHRPRQLELNLWPNRQTLSRVFLKKSATTRKRR
jgi:hypothetical protein